MKKSAQLRPRSEAEARSALVVVKEIAATTGLSVEVLLGLQPMPATVPRADYDRLRDHAALLCHLIGCTIQALESYDTDDGLNELVLAGIVAELRFLQGQIDLLDALRDAGDGRRAEREGDCP